MSVTVAGQDLELYRRELTGYCYRMLGSAFEADDAVQETMLRAWKNADSFEGRSSVRSWVYKIATNVCLDALRGEKRRALPMDLGPSSPPLESLLRPWPSEDIWVTPIPDVKVMPEHGDPAEIAAVRDSVRLAFVTALQHLPARQRAALILCEVLRLPATDATELSSTCAASATASRSTSHRISAARCRAGRCCSAVTNASRTESRTVAISAGSPCSGRTLASGMGVTQRSSDGQGRSSASTGGDDGPRSIGSARRLSPRSASRHTLVAIRYTQDRTLDRPSKLSAFFHARSIVSCTASSASNADPSMR